MPARIPQEQLLDDIERVYEELGEPPTEDQYREHGEHSPSVMRSRFGKYTNAREAADIPNPDQRGGQNRISEDELIEAIQSLAEDLGRTPRRDELNKQGTVSGSACRRAFGSWNEALRAAGYEPVKIHGKERQPCTCKVCGTTVWRLPSSIPESGRVYCSHECQGQWREENVEGEAHPQYNRVTVDCDYCGDEMERKPSVIESKEHLFCDNDCYGMWCSEERVAEDHPRWKGGGDLYYGPNWPVQKRKCRERDDHQCQRCGMTQEESREEYGRALSVHHLKPVREFHEAAEDTPDWQEMNALSNLITLCQGCHRQFEALPVSPQLG